MNTHILVKIKCKCEKEISDILLQREDGSFMDDTIYCEDCDDLTKIPKEKLEELVKNKLQEIFNGIGK